MDQRSANEPRRLISALLVAWILFQTGMALAWTMVDQTPPYWDEACFFVQGAHQLEALRDGGLAEWYETWVHDERIRPSLIATAVVPFFAVLGIHNDAAALANIAALIVVLGSTYALGRMLHGARTGLLAALLLGLSPALIGLAHIVLAEMLMTALVALTLVALWRADGFSRWRPALLAGLCTGLGLLSKVFFPAFVVGPWLYSAYVALRPRTASVPARVRMRCLGLSLALAAAVAALWYLPNLRFVMQRSVDAAVGAEATLFGPADPWHWRNLLGYLIEFVGTNLSVIGALLLVAGSVGLALPERPSSTDPASPPRPRRAGVCFLAASAIIGYVVFMGLRNQDQKHVVGILPALAVLSAWGLTRLMGRRWWMIVSLVVPLAVAQTWLGTFPGEWQARRPAVVLAGRPLYLLFPAGPVRDNTRNAAPSPEHWPLDDILAYAAQMAEPYRGHGRTVRVGVIPDYPGLECCSLRFAALRTKAPVRVEWLDIGEWSEFDALVHKTGDPGWPARVPIIERASDLLNRGQTDFHLMPRTFALPGGDEALIYARRPSPALSAPPNPSQPAQADFGGVGRFLGMDADLGQEGGLRVLDLTCYWETLGASAADQSVFVHLVDPQSGAILLQDDHLLFEGIYPTSQWQPGGWLADARRINLPADLAAPVVLMRLGLYHGDERLPVVSTSAPSGGPTWLDAGSIRLAP